MTLVGIDLGTRKIAIVVLESYPEFKMNEEMAFPFAYESAADLPRDTQLHELAMFAHNASLLHEATSVWIEDTIIGNNRKYSIKLAEAKGAVMSYLSHLRIARGADIRLVDNKTWKKEVVGNGNADKDTVKNYIHDTHPAYAPLCGDDQDLYDATCVALYGLRVLGRAEGLKLG